MAIEFKTLDDYIDNLDMIDLQMKEIQLKLLQHRQMFQDLVKNGNDSPVTDLEFVNDRLDDIVQWLSLINDKDNEHNDQLTI